MKVDCYVLRTPAITNCMSISDCRPTYSYSLVSQMSTFLCKQACTKCSRLCNSSGRSAHSAVQTVKKTKTELELGNLHAKLAQFRNSSALWLNCYPFVRTFIVKYTGNIHKMQVIPAFRILHLNFGVTVHTYGVNCNGIQAIYNSPSAKGWIISCFVFLAHSLTASVKLVSEQ